MPGKIYSFAQVDFNAAYLEAIWNNIWGEIVVCDLQGSEGILKYLREPEDADLLNIFDVLVINKNFLTWP